MRLTLAFLCVVLICGCTREPRNAQAVTQAPARQEGADAFGDVKVAHDITFASPGGVELKLDVYQPWPLPEARQLPVVIYFHGGGWRSGDKKGGTVYLDALARRGILGFSANYRLSPKYVFPTQLDDARAAVEWVAGHAADYGGDGSRIGVFGTSAGGHLAALLGTAGDDIPVRAVADWYGPADLRQASLWPRQSLGMIDQLLGSSPAQAQQLAAHASPVAQVSSGDAAFLIIHGTADPTVPLSQSQELRDALQQAGVEVQYVEVNGGGHGGFGRAKTAELIDTMAGFFKAHL